MKHLSFKVRFQKPTTKSFWEPSYARQVGVSGISLTTSLAFPRQVGHLARDQLGPIHHRLYPWVGGGQCQLSYAAEGDRALQDNALLREEMRIKDVRMARIPPHQRPLYPPPERMAILGVKAARGRDREGDGHSALHPGARGYRVIADLLVERLAHILGQQQK